MAKDTDLQARVQGGLQGACDSCPRQQQDKEEGQELKKIHIQDPRTRKVTQRGVRSRAWFYKIKSAGEQQLPDMLWPPDTRNPALGSPRTLVSARGL